jgi:L-lactate dehydrogenase (cytochrome)
MDLLEDFPVEWLVGCLGVRVELPAPISLPAPNQVVKSVPRTKRKNNVALPPIQSIISAHDFEVVASSALTPKAWAFYSSAATDLVTHTNNKRRVRDIMFRPRILRDVSAVNYRTKILGVETSAPFFMSPVAMANLAHPEGELAFRRAAAHEGILQCVGF